jgi:hypothetical protein
MTHLTLQRIRNTNFDELFEKLLLAREMTSSEYEVLLSIATIFVNENNPNVTKLGHRIFVLYSNLTGDYRPLYDTALNTGLIPVVKLIERIERYGSRFEDSFFNNFYSSYSETYKRNDIYLSDQQKALYTFFRNTMDETVSIVAPTSYGKSEMIISGLQESTNRNICVLVPTKALLAQTRRRVLEADIEGIGKIITHPDMYTDGIGNITAILTQERLLRLLRKYPTLKFDIVFVDEAHNLLQNDNRSILLAAVISILAKRNNDVIFKFLTPFLFDSSNLRVRYSNYDPKPFRITEYIKTEKIYLYDFRSIRTMKLYDQFVNKFISMSSMVFDDDVDLVIRNSSDKNIIYLNKPSDLEDFSERMLVSLPEVSTERIERACRHISEYLHDDYLLVRCIRHGFIYHHGSVPDNVRMYIEHLYAVENKMKYVVTSSTLLEGVNLPAYALFMLDTKKGRSNLSSSQFQNLVGRVCRFSDVFSRTTGDLKKLEPIVFLVGSNYVARHANLENFLKQSMRVDKDVQDNPVNVLLKEVDTTDANRIQKERADEFIENFEYGVIRDYEKSYARTEVGKSCFANNVTEIDIIANEQLMQRVVDDSRGKKITSVEHIFDFFARIFLPFIDDNHNNLKRLSNVESRRFYEMFLSWRIRNASYREIIRRFLGHWTRLEQNGGDTLVYVGRWGDKIRGNGQRKIWSDMREKGPKERINLAIVRAKEEQDFLDNVFIKFIEVLHDLSFLEKELYLKIKYGTSDMNKIVLIGNGISLGLANLLVDTYGQYVSIDREVISIDSAVTSKMRENDENDILVYEMSFHRKLFS